MGRHQQRKQRLPYAKWPARRCRDAFVRLRWKILRDRPVYGWLFTSDLMLVEPERPDFPHQWLDFLFLGLDGRTIWNAEISTAALAFDDRIDSLAFDQAWSLLTKAEQDEELRYDGERVWVGSQIFYRTRSRKPRTYPALDGLTFAAGKARIATETIACEPPCVHESFQTDRTFAFGIGLRLVVDAAAIDQAVVEATIERFRAGGEVDWQNAEPVPRERLPNWIKRTGIEA